MSNTVRHTLMSHNADTGDLVCYVANNQEVLRIVEPDIEKAHSISKAIQDAYRAGHTTGRVQMQLHLEATMDAYNRS